MENIQPVQETKMTAGIVRGGILLLATTTALPAVAQPPAQPSAAQPQRALDPNQIVCEKQEILGSRLSSRRICHTRAQWADLRLQDRQAIEKIQVNRPLKGE
ncbi:MAG: hypothetical protein ABIW03_07290 [Sphingomicrobium sp.]